MILSKSKLSFGINLAFGPVGFDVLQVGRRRDSTGSFAILFFVRLGSLPFFGKVKI